ncbi:MAG: polysaccharide deacetylase family protein [Bacilli bacterium]
MIKKIFFLLLCLLLVGCNKYDGIQVETIVIKQDKIVSAINRPITGIKKLDYTTNKFIQKEYKQFIKNNKAIDIKTHKAEFNIDYHYNVVNKRFINIVIYTYIDSFYLKTPVTQVKTFVFDIKKNKFLIIDDVVVLNKYLLKKINKSLDVTKKVTIDDLKLFTFNDTSFKFYLSNKIITTDNTKMTLKIKIKQDKKKAFKVANFKDKVIDPNKPVIALTFDDGPSKYTKLIVDFLDESGACATFFVLGNKVPIYEETLHTMLINGNEIGNHSFSHKWLTKLNTTGLKNQIDQTQTIIKQKLNYVPKYLRPTYGSVNKRLRDSTNLEIVLWNVDTMDWKLKNSEKIASRALNNVKSGNIILMHDTYERTFKAVKKLVPVLKNKGYQFVTISELKEYNYLNKKIESN